MSTPRFLQGFASCFCFCIWITLFFHSCQYIREVCFIRDDSWLRTFIQQIECKKSSFKFVNAVGGLHTREADTRKTFIYPVQEPLTACVIQLSSRTHLKEVKLSSRYHSGNLHLKKNQPANSYIFYKLAQEHHEYSLC